MGLHLQMGQLLLVFTAELFGGLIQGCSGIGLNLVAVPILMLVDHAYVPGPALCTAALMTAVILSRDRGPRTWTTSRPCLIGRIPGTLAGAGVLLLVSTASLELIASCAIISGVLISATGRLSMNLTTRNGLVAGAVSAFFATTASVGGPPLAIYFHRENGSQLRALIALNVMLGSVFSLVVLTALGHFGRSDLALFLTLVPGMLAGFALSSLIRTHLSDRRVRWLALAVALLGALILGARGALTLIP